MIREQVKLPLSVAMGVVLQGIRIRFGRSVVTIMGVVLGIAFLMSILSGQVIRKGVSGEEELRLEARRMYSFLLAEAGPPRDRTVAVLQVGRLSDDEIRLVKTLFSEGVGKVKWATASAAVSVPASLVGKVAQTSQAGLGDEAIALLVTGDGPLPSEDWSDILKTARQKVICLTRKNVSLSAGPGVRTVTLKRDLTADEVERRALDEKRTKFRNLWILTIALLVTVIGISNSMLMSVTERFKEIGTMKCLGALSAFIRRLFLIESSFMGVVGSVIGSLFGVIFSLLIYGATYGFGVVITGLDAGLLMLYFVGCFATGIILSVLAAIYPASIAARMVPATALRTNI